MPLTELMLAISVGLLFSGAIYLLLGRTLVRMVLGLLVLANATNLSIFVMGRITRDKPPLIPENRDFVPLEAIANPLPQALILTAIVISFALTAFILVLTFRAHQEMGTMDTDKMRLAEPKALIKAPVIGHEEPVP